jgi:hypothetical protein
MWIPTSPRAEATPRAGSVAPHTLCLSGVYCVRRRRVVERCLNATDIYPMRF